MNFNDEQNSDSFPNQFLSMPELDEGMTAATETTHGVQLLAEFDINDDTEDGIATRIRDKENSTDALNSLNCILPSIGNDPIDDVSMVEVMTFN